MMRRLVMLAMLIPGAAQAQSEGFDAHGFFLAPGDGDLHDLLTVWRPERQVPMSFGIDGLFEYANQPLVLMQQSGDDLQRLVLLNDVFALNLGGHAAFHERVGVALTVPVWFYSSSPVLDNQTLGVGDIRLHVPIGIVLPDAWSDKPSFGLSVVPMLNLPSGQASRFLGSQGLGAGGFLVAGLNGKRWSTSADAGIAYSPKSAYENLNGGTSLNFGLGGSYALLDTLSVRGEAVLRPTLTTNEFKLTESPGEAILSLRGRYDQGLSWTLGGATAITRGVSAARFRLFLGFGWTFGKPLVRDTDGDGFLDADDACPEQAETFNGYLDADGCPDALAELAVQVFEPEGAPAAGVPVFVDGKQVGITDAEGWVRLSDLMPGTAVQVGAEPDRATAMAGPAALDLDLVEGAQQAEVRLGWLPGSVRVIARTGEGQPIDAEVSFIGPLTQEPFGLGDDGQGIAVLPPGQWALFVSADSFGTERRDIQIEPDQRSLVVIEITMMPATVQITREEVLILEQIQFDFDSAAIKAESIPILEEVANNLLTHPTLKQVEIQGHTDSDGPNRYNADLSQRRMDSVMGYLVERGLDPDRLVPVGYGEECPLVANDTPENKAINRRVQFIILDPPPTDGIIPCRDGAPARRAEARKIEVVE